MRNTSDRPVPQRNGGFRAGSKIYSTRKPPPAEITVQACQDTPPGTGGKNFGGYPALPRRKPDSPPESDDDDESRTASDMDGRGLFQVAQWLKPELQGQKAAVIGQLADTGAPELQAYLGHWSPPTSGNGPQHIPAPNYHQGKDGIEAISTAGIELNPQPQKHTGAHRSQIPPSDPAVTPRRNHNSETQRPQSVVHLVNADYAYRGPFFVRNISQSKTGYPAFGTPRKNKVGHSSKCKNRPPRAVSANLRRTSSPVCSNSGSVAESTERSEFLVGLPNEPENPTLKTTGTKPRNSDRTAGELAEKRPIEADLGFETPASTENAGLSAISNSPGFKYAQESDEYDAHNPALFSAVPRRPSVTRSRTESQASEIVKLCPEDEQRRTSRIWSFFGYLMCNLTTEGIIQDHEYQEHSLWKTCLSLDKDNGSIGVFARMHDATMVALGVPVGLIPRVRKELILWTLSTGGDEDISNGSGSYGTADEDNRSFVTWGSGDE